LSLAEVLFFLFLVSAQELRGFIESSFIKMSRSLDLIFYDALFLLANAQQCNIVLSNYLLHCRNTCQKSFIKRVRLLIISAIAQIITLRKRQSRTR